MTTHEHKIKVARAPMMEFSVSIETDDSTGDVLSVYFQIRRGKVHDTREFADGAAFVDYDRSGYLLGIELLSPCWSSIVEQLAANESIEIRQKTKQCHEHKIKVACSRAGCAWAAALLVGVLLGLSTMLNDFTEAVGLY